MCRITCPDHPREQATIAAVARVGVDRGLGSIVPPLGTGNRSNALPDTGKGKTQKNGADANEGPYRMIGSTEPHLVE